MFEGTTATGKSTLGWFYGFKLHLIINDKGEILHFVITQANVDDREPIEKQLLFNKRACCSSYPKRINTCF